MGVCMVLKAVTNKQLNDFYDDQKALQTFLERTSDPRVMLFRMFGEAAKQNPKYATMMKFFGGVTGMDESAAVQDSSPQADLDKVWHGLHWIFTGTAYEGTEPLCYLCHKGLVLGQFRDSEVRGISSKQLAAFEAALEPFDEAELRRRYDGAAMAAADIYLSVMWQRDTEEGIESLSHWLAKLKVFLKEAKSRNEGMLIWTT